jgi:hypothetical protein
MFLKQYVAAMNRISKAFKLPEIDLDNMLPGQADEIFAKLDSDMSPEVLHQDGERPAGAAHALAASYTQVFEELKSLGYIPPKDMYHF